MQPKAAEHSTNNSLQRTLVMKLSVDVGAKGYLCFYLKERAKAVM